jgi:glycosyltransferase involved in cell wall biosynthesis
MNLTAFTRYGPLGASSRVRTMQYRAALARAGVTVRVASLLDDEYLRRKYAGSVPWVRVARAYAWRLRDLGEAALWSDVLWIEKELWPWAPARLELAGWRRKPVVLDYDDAIFHKYDQHQTAAVRRVYGGKIDALMRAASIVIAGNEYLAERAHRAGAVRVEILPTVVDLDRYPPPRRRPSGTAGTVAIGWIGSPVTVPYLRALEEPLARLARGRPMELRVIGAHVDMAGVRTVEIPWSEGKEVQAITDCDIGIMPLPDSPWERAKCGYKLIQYMACGLPVVASPIGVNTSIVVPGENGYLASSAAQWEAALAELAGDAGMRERLGAAGRAAVESHYCLQVTAPRLIEWLRGLT